MKKIAKKSTSAKPTAKRATTQERNQKVAKNRGSKWKQKLREGKLDSQMNPTVLKLKRINKGLSQEQMATKLELSQTSYGAIERGRRNVNKSIASNISRLLKTPASKLFTKNEAGSLIATV